MLKSYSDRTLSLLLFISASFWGVYWYPIREIGNHGVDGAWSVVLFNACPLIVLLPLFFWRFKHIRPHLKHASISAIFIGLGLATYAIGLVFAPVVRVTMLFYLTPIWSTLIGVLWLSETLTKGRIIAIGLGLFGIVLLLYKTEQTGQPLNIGDVFAFASGIFWSIGAATLKRFPDTSTLAITTLQFAVTAITAVFFSLVLFNAPAPELETIKSAFGIALVTSILILLPSVVLIFEISKVLYPGRVGILMMSEVIVAIISASFFLPDEQLSIVQWAGAIAILAAAFTEVIYGEVST